VRAHTHTHTLTYYTATRPVTKPSITRLDDEVWCRVQLTYRPRLICFAFRRRLPWQPPQQPQQPGWFISPDAGKPIHQILSVDRHRPSSFRPCGASSGFCQHRRSLLWRSLICKPSSWIPSDAVSSDILWESIYTVTVSQKKRHRTLVHIFTGYWPMLKNSFSGTFSRKFATKLESKIHITSQTCRYTRNAQHVQAAVESNFFRSLLRSSVFFLYTL